MDKSNVMKKLFLVVSIIGFSLPFVLFVLLQLPNESFKILDMYFLPRFNLVYFAIIIVLFFVGLKVEWVQLSQILFITVYILYLCIDYFILAPVHVKEFAKKYPNSKIVKISEFKKLPEFKLLYKNGGSAVVIIEDKNYTEPFKYKKDRGYR